MPRSFYEHLVPDTLAIYQDGKKMWIQTANSFAYVKILHICGDLLGKESFFLSLFSCLKCRAYNGITGQRKQGRLGFPIIRKERVRSDK